MNSQAHRSKDNDRSQKSRGNREAAEADHDQENLSAQSADSAVLRKQGTGPLSRSAVLRMQRQFGNAFVKRKLGARRDLGGESTEMAGVQRQDETGEAPASAASGGTSIGDGSASVSAVGGTVKAQAGVINLDAAMVTAPGTLQVDTIIANNVVGSNYTPGAGNVM